MCGISGFVDFDRNTEYSILNNMVLASKHRGPDDYGTEMFDDSFALVGIGQTRLSIIDLSEAGHQPMFYRHLSIVFNGEIYNYKEIREELIQKGHNFISNSDTEVILHAYEEWKEKCVDKFIGMYAFCIYDKSKNEIVIFRDRVGVKPLYYYYHDNLFLFASELKSFFEHTSFKKNIDKNVLCNYLTHGYIPAPHSIFENTFKLMPGYYLSLDFKTKTLTTHKYWDILDYYKKEKLKIDYTTAKEELHGLLKSAFQYRMVSDVPVGVFLSGGYDSTAVTAILQSHSSEKLKTFTIGFEEGNNEAPYAKQTAKYFGTEHTEYYCTKNEAQELISTLSFYYDEPFGDSSAIPTMLVSRIAKKDVTVSLSADGGDEIFCGYDSYEKFDKYLKFLKYTPGVIGKILGTTGKQVVNYAPSNNDVLKYQGSVIMKAVEKGGKIAYANTFYQELCGKPPVYINKFLRNTSSHKSPYDIDTNGFKDSVEIAMAIDFQNYLTNDVLTKVDRATMSVSLEGREPFLDFRVIEFAAQLPLNYKFDGKQRKRILKDIVHDYIPKEYMERPKAGFSVPVMKWLRTDLSYLLDEYLSTEALKWSGLFNEEFVSREVEKFKQGKLHYTPIVWYLLIFQMWYKRWMIETH